MWLRQLVGTIVVISLLAMNTIVVVGLLTPSDTHDPDKQANNPAIASSLPPPTVTISAESGTIAAQSLTTLDWTTKGYAKECTASGDWEGKKTPFGAESTGRLTEVKTYTFKITCSNDGGSADASINIIVTEASAAPATSAPAKSTSGSSASSGSGPTYCSGRIPCYGPSEVATHNKSDNCWGYNGDRVINITGFDVAYHQAKTGISSIQIANVCGTDLAPSLNGNVSAGGQTRNHNQTTKNNNDKNEISYFYGFYDASK